MTVIFITIDDLDDHSEYMKEPKSYNQEFDSLEKECIDNEHPVVIEYLVKWEGLGKFLINLIDYRV